jgi:N-acetyl-gamma-glutamyl-phosphate reductase
MAHKHVPEMQVHCGLAARPLFSPAVIAAYRGMATEIPLPLAAMQGAAGPERLRDCLAAFFAGSPVVRMGAAAEGELLLRASAAASDVMELYVFASEDGSQARLVATLDNLGKGASGAAVQSLNLMAGLSETAGLRL